MKYFALSAAALALAACVNMESMAKLAPVNALAEQTGAAEGHITSVGTSTGDLVVMLPGRVVLQGSYDAKSAGFGTVFDQAYPGMRGQQVIIGSPCVANLTGDNGLSMKCEFYNDDFKNHGFGSCLSSGGALYKLTY